MRVSEARRPDVMGVLLFVLFLGVVDGLVCNRGTDYACICRPDADATATPPSVPLCEKLIQPKQLPVVEVKMRYVDMNSPTGSSRERFEDYFKSKMASMVSAYCQFQAHDCPGVRLRLQSHPDDDVVYAGNEYDPLLTQENVVVLRIEPEPANVTRVLFAVLNRIGQPLTEDTVVEPVKVKYILATQPGPLSRVLGGIRVTLVTTARIEKPVEDADNTALLIKVFIAATFFIVCYIIGIIRMLRDCKRRKKERKKNEESQIGNKKTPNYGACQGNTDNGQNGHPLSRRSIGIESPSPRPPPDPLRPRTISEREARLMFTCDPSQLPREQSTDDTRKASIPAVVLTQSPTEMPIIQEPSPAPIRRSSSPQEPLLIHRRPSSPHDPSLLPRRPSSPREPSLLPRRPSSPLDPLHRPKSRRGSRVDDTAETIDLRERLPDQVIYTEQPDHEYSSSEGEVDVYYKLSEEDDVVQGDEWPIKGDWTIVEGAEKQTQQIVFKGRTNGYLEDEEDEDEDEKGGYERLRESPVEDA